MGSDFAALYDSGAALWRGQYVGLYPLPFNAAMALLALLPYPIALALVTFGGLALFVAAFRRRALLWIFFTPVLMTLWQGQVDLIWLWLLHDCTCNRGSGVSLALMTLKPQLAVLALPALLADRAKWRPFAIACAVLYGPVTIVRPSWILEWLKQCNDGRLDWTGSTTILSSPLIGFALMLAASFLWRLDWRAVFWSVNPTLRWYDFSLMAGRSSLWLIR